MFIFKVSNVAGIYQNSVQNNEINNCLSCTTNGGNAMDTSDSFIHNSEMVREESQSPSLKCQKHSKNYLNISNDSQYYSNCHSSYVNHEGSTTTLNVSCRCNSLLSNSFNQSASLSSSSSLSSSPSSSALSSPSTTSMLTFCTKCSNTEIENNKTKCKLDHLRLIMQQKKQRREARKLKNLPYNSQARVLGTTTAAATTSLAQLNSPADVQPNHIVEEVDSVA